MWPELSHQFFSSSTNDCKLEWTFGCPLPSEAVRLCNGFREDLVQPLFVSIRIVLPTNASKTDEVLLGEGLQRLFVGVSLGNVRSVDSIKCCPVNLLIPWRRKMFRSDQSEMLEKQKHCYESYTFITSRVLGMARVFIRYFRKTNGGSILRTVPAIVSWGALPTDLPWKVSGK